MKLDKCYIFCIRITNNQKNLQQFNQFMVVIEENMIGIRDPKTFDCPK